MSVDVKQSVPPEDVLNECLRLMEETQLIPIRTEEPFFVTFKRFVEQVYALQGQILFQSCPNCMSASNSSCLQEKDFIIEMLKDQLDEVRKTFLPLQIELQKREQERASFENVKKELDDLKKELSSIHKELNSTHKELDSAQKELASSQKELASSQKELASTRNAYELIRADLKNSRRENDEMYAELMWFQTEKARIVSEMESEKEKEKKDKDIYHKLQLQLFQTQEDLKRSQVLSQELNNQVQFFVTQTINMHTLKKKKLRKNRSFFPVLS